MHESLRPTRAIVDLDAIAHNVRLLQSQAPQAAFMAVVKAEGYGHGAVPVAKAALAAGASWLGVALIEEAVKLRQAGLTAPILVFGYVPPQQVGLAVQHDVRIACFRAETAQALAAEAQRQDRTARVHVKVDTGMGRVGVQPSEAPDFLRSLQALPGVEAEGIFTHLAVADAPDDPYTDQQLDTFDAVLHTLETYGLRPPIRHAANSASILAHPRAHYDLVRGGIALYGQPPDPAVGWPPGLKPALRWETQLGHIKVVEPGTAVSYGCTYRSQQQEKIATLPIGYADGYSRLLSNRGEVLVQGVRCPIVGRVCMDQLMVRLPLDLDVASGEPAVLLGESGGAVITASDLAALMGTINYEVLCLISGRVPRIYAQDGLII